MSTVLINSHVDNQTMQGIYASRLQSSLLKFARSITLQPISLSLKIVPSAAHMDAPAYSSDTGIHVFHDRQQGTIASASSIIRLKGLTVHEIAHMLYTPRGRTKLVQWVQKNALHQAFNILEDNRIENLMVSRFSGVAPWLVHTITQEFLKGKSAQELFELLPLVWGRKYIPQDVRTNAYKSWPHQNQKEVASVIDEYILLNLQDKDDIERAKQLISQFSHLTQRTNVKSSQHLHGVTCSPDNGSSQPISKGQIDKDLKNVEDNVNQQATPADIEQGDYEQSANDMGDGPDDSAQPGSSPTNGEIVQAIQSALGDAQSDVLEDVKNTIQGIKDTNSEASFSRDEDYGTRKHVIKPLAKSMLKYESVSPEMMSSSRLFARQLQEVRAMFDPAWVRKSDKGRLNVRDFVLNGNLDEAFDEWDHGNADVTDIECVILLDNSGSMRSMITPAYESMWAIKRAMDTINADTTVIQYGTWGDILYSADDKATTRMATAIYQGGGSTQPLNSILKAQEIFNNSSRAIKMLINITDGEWGSATSCNQAIATLRAQGVMTGLVYLQDPATPEVYIRRDEFGNEQVDAHYCEVAQKLTNPRDIVEFAKSFAKISQKRLLDA